MKAKHHRIQSASVIKRSDHVRNSSIRRKWFALASGGFFFASITLSLPSILHADCKQWSVGHGWRFKQGPTPVDMNLKQNGTVVTGKASFIATTEKASDGVAGIGSSFGGKGEIHGDVDGTVKGDRFAVIIHWDNNTTAVYEGTIGPSGRIEGTTYNQAKPSQKVSWYSETHMMCADAAASAPGTASMSGVQAAAAAAAEKAAKEKAAAEKLRRAQADQIKAAAEEEKAAAAGASSSAPFIRANPTTVSVPAGQTTGTTTLSWDAGKNHPYAEVWVKVDDADEKFVVEQGKGSRQVSVKPGRTYLYILSDSNERLGTVTVRGTQ